MARTVPPVEEYDAYDEYNRSLAEADKGADVGYYNAPTQRFAAPNSTRRYTVERPIADPRANLRKAGQPATSTKSRKTVDYTSQVADEREDDEVRYDSRFARRTTGSRPSRTDEDKQITTRIRRVDTSAPAPHGVSRRKVVAGIVGAAIVGLVGGNAAINTIHDWQLRWAQGPYPVRDLELVCGHGDSVDHPTLLHIYIWDYVLVSMEAPGGHYGKEHQEVGNGLPTTGDMSKWDLQVLPVKVGVKQYQIEITVTGVSGSGQYFNYHGLLVDSGHGYFVIVDTK